MFIRLNVDNMVVRIAKPGGGDEARENERHRERERERERESMSLKVYG